MCATPVERIQTPTGASVWKKNPTLYEINTWVWLTDLSRKHGKIINLSSVPSAECDRSARIHANGYSGCSSCSFRFHRPGSA